MLGKNKNNEINASFSTIIEVIKNTLDIKKTKDTITEAVCKSLNADRCFIVDYDSNINKFLPIQHEYLSSPKIKSCKGENVHEIVPNLIDVAKSGKTILIKNDESLLNNKQDFSKEKETFDKYNIRSIFAVPLFYQKKLLGVLSIHYIDKARNIGKFEENLMKDIANQTVIAIHQANLYKINQIQLEKAELLRKIIDASRKSLILENVLTDICKEIITLFKIQSISIGKLFTEDPADTIFAGESISGKNMKTYQTHPGFNDLIEYWTNYLRENKKTKIIESVIDSDLPQNVIDVYKELGVKFLACMG